MNTAKIDRVIVRQRREQVFELVVGSGVLLALGTLVTALIAGW